jgi:uncharacterized membrane protein YesL
MPGTATPRAVVRWLLVIEGLLLLTVAPGLVPLTILERAGAGIPLIALALLPVGPAVAAAVFAWRRFGEDPDGSPVRHFWRGYRLNLIDSLKVWIPALIALTAVALNLTNLGNLPSPVAFGVLGAGVAVLVVAWTAHAMVVASLFSFRLRDTIRIGAYFVLRAKVASLGAIALAAAAVAVWVFTAGWVLALLGSVGTYLLARNARPVVAEVERRFVVGAPDAVVGKPWPGLSDDEDPSDDELPAD